MANLWDVTDADIDRFSRATLQKWLQSRGSTSRTVHLQSSATECISRTVSNSRVACRLPFLNGAAPVCYGIPTAVELRSS